MWLNDYFLFFSEIVRYSPFLFHLEGGGGDGYSNGRIM